MSTDSSAYILVLLPENSILKGELRITEFPFQIGRKLPALKSMRTDNSESRMVIGKISSMHAEVYQDGDSINVRDLGSLNGTYVNKVKLDEGESATIKDGDRISFSEYADFIIQLQKSSQSTMNQDESVEITVNSDNLSRIPEGDDSEYKSTIPATPSPVSSQTDKPQEEKPVQPQQPKPQTVQKPSPMNSKEVADEPKSVQKSVNRTARKYKPILAVLVVLFVTAIFGVLYYQFIRNPVRQMTSYIHQGKYREAIIIGNQVLEDTDNAEVKDLTEEAALKYLTEHTDWPASMKSGAYKSALGKLDQVEATAKNSNALNDIFGFLRIATQFLIIAERIEKNGHLTIFEDDVAITSVMVDWNLNRDGYKTAGIRAHKLTPKCPDLPSRIVPISAQFENLLDTAVKRVGMLKRDSEQALKTGEPEKIKQLCLTFESTAQSSIAVDISPLKQDLGLYLSIEEAIKGTNPEPLLKVSRESFKTPLVRKYGDILLQKVPSKDVLSTLASARTQWQAGNGAAAIALLNGMDTSQWPEAIASLKKRYQEKLNSHKELKGMALPIDSSKREYVIDIYRTVLGDTDDAVYRDSVKPLYDSALASVQQEANGKYSDAEDAWTTYTGMGKLIQKHRLDDSASGEFVEMAGHLSVAVRSIEYWARLISMAELPVQDAQKGLQKTILSECRFQRRRLRELIGQLPESTINKKLQYLPEISEE